MSVSGVCLISTGKFWLGLTPKQRSTGCKQVLGGISRQGDERLRQLFGVGAMAVIHQAKPGSRTASPWLLQLLERRPRKLSAVALANEIARTRGHDDEWRGVADAQSTQRRLNYSSMPGYRKGCWKRAGNGRSDEQQNPFDLMAFTTKRVFGAVWRSPSGPAVICRANRPDP
jgi:hypothetical protein